ncbi:MAG: TerB family tellurite resistance protein [Candidatus Brocadiia bacterium]
MNETQKPEEHRTSDRTECRNVFIDCRKTGFLHNLLGRGNASKSGKPTPVQDISPTGCRFLSDREFKTGERVDLGIDFGPRRPSVDLRGEIQWSRSRKGRFPYETGVRFVEVEPEDWEKLAGLGDFVVKKSDDDAWRLRSRDRANKPMGALKSLEEDRKGASLASVFVRLSDSQDVKDLKGLIAAQEDVLPDRDKTGSKTAEIRLSRKIADIRNAVEETTPETDPLRAFFRLRDLSDQLYELEHIKFRKEIAKERSVIRSKIEGKRRQALDQFDDATAEKIEKLGLITRKLRKSLKKAVERLEGDRTAKAEGQSASLEKNVKELDSLCRQIAALVSDIPGADRPNLPSTALVRAAREHILRPHNRNRFLFKCAARVANADGEMKVDEEDFLNALATHIHLSAEEAEKLVAESNKLEEEQFDGTAEEARAVVEKLYLCAVADDELSQDELNALEQIARSWGLSEDEIEQVLADRKKLHQLTKQGRSYMRKAVAMLDKSRQAETDESFSEVVESLGRSIERIQSLMQNAPGVEIKDIPDWDLLARAQKSIVNPWRRNFFLFNCAVHLTRADGQMTEEEIDFLKTIGKQIRLEPKELQLLFDNPQKIQLSEFQGSREQVRQLVHRLYLCAQADGVVHESEERLLRHVGKALGVEDEEFPKLARKKSER